MNQEIRVFTESFRKYTYFLVSQIPCNIYTHNSSMNTVLFVNATIVFSENLFLVQYGIVIANIIQNSVKIIDILN